MSTLGSLFPTGENLGSGAPLVLPLCRPGAGVMRPTCCCTSGPSIGYSASQSPCSRGASVASFIQGFSLLCLVYSQLLVVRVTKSGMTCVAILVTSLWPASLAFLEVFKHECDIVQCTVLMEYSSPQAYLKKGKNY